MRRHARVWAFAGLSLCCVLALAAAAEPAIGPARRDADGRFANSDRAISHGSLGVRLPFFLRRAVASFSPRPGAAAVVVNDGAFLRENARHSVPTVTWVGHATLLVQMDHLTFLTDPTWSDVASPLSFAGPPRLVSPGIALANLPPIDFVLISHNHFDHLDLPTLEALALRDSNTRFFVPLANGELLRARGIENVHELDWGDTVAVGDVIVRCLPAQHWSRRGVFDERRALWSSWAVTGRERRFYFGGDTGYFSGFETIGREFGPFDLAAIGIGAYEPAAMMQEVHLDPEQAVEAGVGLRAERILGIHFGTFDLADEPLEEPPRRMREAGRVRGLADDRIWILDIGETRGF
ncbi:MAG: MBL fold metallo-hydrolase [bacterium]|nr:MBL fold metallo-hydrolase [bacterium]